LLDENPKANREEIKHALAGNICRCTGYIQIFESVEAAKEPVVENKGGQNE
jgi:carbon-monoxide dehydrogenase small subunit